MVYVTVTINGTEATVQDVYDVFEKSSKCLRVTGVTSNDVTSIREWSPMTNFSKSHW